MSYLLDTNAWIAYLNRQDSSAAESASLGRGICASVPW